MMKHNEDFDKIYKDYIKFSMRVAFRIVRNKEIAEDISHEVFCNLYKMGDKLNTSNERMLHALIFDATVNKAKDYLKSAYAKRETCTIDNDDGMEIEDDNHNPETMMLRIEETQCKKSVLSKLRRENPMNYEILMKTKHDQIPPDDVAEEYGITRNNVNNRILRTRNWLRKELLKLDE